MTQPTFYWIRCWHPEDQKVRTWKFSLDEITWFAQMYHMNMVDVGLVFLNVERVKAGLEPIPADVVAGVEAYYPEEAV